ncbi:hypothetical protein Acr_08g0013140 [Actinidia rufa]|uniref:Uncharacterized protein n=1 Tax=Actinidia rufa TaxID=165716 RepID=A0A7J0F2I7_9ERIC|nr:hypothetical protein Acr_08g0013140 [Actinidia rufa]
MINKRIKTEPMLPMKRLNEASISMRRLVLETHVIKHHLGARELEKVVRVTLLRLAFQKRKTIGVGTWEKIYKGGDFSISNSLLK